MSSTAPFDNIPFPLPDDINTRFLEQRMYPSQNEPKIAIYTTLNISRIQLRGMADKVELEWQAAGGIIHPPLSLSLCMLAIPGDASSEPVTKEKFAFPEETLLDILRYHVCVLQNDHHVSQTPDGTHIRGFSWETRGFMVFTSEDVAKDGVWVVWELYEELEPELQAKILTCRLSFEDSLEVFMLMDCDGCGMLALHEDLNLEKPRILEQTAAHKSEALD